MVVRQKSPVEELSRNRQKMLLFQLQPSTRINLPDSLSKNPPRGGVGALSVRGYMANGLQNKSPNNAL